MRGHIITFIVLLSIAGASAAPALIDVDIIPSPLIPGEEVTITYTVTDEEPLNSVSTDIELGNSINKHFNEHTNKNTYSFVEKFFVPETYSGTINLELLIRVVDETPIFRVIPLTTEQEEETIEFNIIGDDDIVIFVDPIRDVESGDAVYYPVIVRNQGDKEQEVLLGLEDVRLWATYRIDPEATITLPPKTEELVYVYLAVGEQASPGRKVFSVTAEYDGNKEEEKIQVAILDPEKSNFSRALAHILIVIGIILIIVAIIILFIHYKEKDDDIITYY